MLVPIATTHIYHLKNSIFNRLFTSTPPTWSLNTRLALRLRATQVVLSIALALPALTTTVSSQPVQSFRVDSLSAVFQSTAFSDRVERKWISSRPLQEDNEHGFTEAIYLNLRGSIYHPRLLSWFGNGRLTLKQRLLSSEQKGSDNNIYEDIKEYRLQGRFLKDHPLSFGLTATRAVSDVDGDFLEAVNVNRNSFSSNISWRMNRLNQLADYSRWHYTTEGLVKNDEIRRTLRYEANLRLDRFRNKLSYEYSDNDYVTSKRSFIGHSARYSGTLLLDRRGRQTLVSSFLYNKQQNELPIRVAQGSLAANLTLKENINATASFSHRADRIDTTRSKTNLGAVRLVHRFYESLVTSLNGEGRFANFDTGEQMDVTPSSRINYRKRTFFGNLRLSSGLAYRRYKEEFNELTQRLLFKETSYALATPIILEESGIDSATIEILNLSRPGQIPLRGLDFLVDALGDFFEITIPLSSSIQDGDSLRISYVVLSERSFEFDEWTQHYGIGISLSTFAEFRASLQKSDRTLISGNPLNPLDDVKIDIVALNLKYRMISLEGQYSYRRTNLNPYKRRGVVGRYVRQISRRANAVLSSSYVVTNFVDSKEHSKVLSISGYLRYQPYRNMSVESGLSNIKRSGRRDDGHDLTWRNRVRYTLGRIEADLLVNVYDRKISVAGTEDRTYMRLSVKRYF